MDEEIIAGNKLIDKWYKSTGQHVTIVARPEQMQYHCSWDALMPVIQKIGKDYNVRITWTADGATDGYDVTYIERPDVFDKELADFGGFGPITNTWKCAVKFIEWHNQKFKNKK